MRQISFILLILAVGLTHGYSSSGFQGNTLTGFRVKYAPSQPNIDGYFQMPKTTREASSLGFRSIPYRSDHGYDLSLSCYNGDVRVCVLFDKFGNVAGMQIAIPKRDVESVAHNIGRYMKLKTFLGHDYWTTSYLFESPETMRKGGRRGPVRQTFEEIWIEIGNEFTKIPLTETELSQRTLFKKQNCYAGMGTHYPYEMGPNLDCKNFLPHFVLVKNGKVIGIKLQVFGKTQQSGRQWFESPPAALGQVIVPSAPACLGNLAQTYGLISLHTFFIEEPWKITCEARDNV